MWLFIYVHFFFFFFLHNRHILNFFFNEFANWLLPVSLTNLIINEVSFVEYKRKNAVFLLLSVPRRRTGLKCKLIGFALNVERHVRLWFNYFKLHCFQRYRYLRVISCRVKALFRKKRHGPSWLLPLRSDTSIQDRKYIISTSRWYKILIKKRLNRVQWQYDGLR